MISRGAGLDPPWPLASPWEGQGSPWDLAPLCGQGLLEGLLLLSSPGELGLPLGRGGGEGSRMCLVLLSPSCWLLLLGVCEQQGWSHLIGIGLGQGQR